MATPLERAILIMYGLIPPPTPTAQQDAITWLLEYQDKEEAWHTFLPALSAAAQPQVQFYLANALFTKICRQWGELTDEQQRSFSELVWQLVQRCAKFDATTVRRLGLALARTALQAKAPGVLPAFLSRAGCMAEAALAADVGGISDIGNSRRALAATLELLRAVAEEANATALSGERKARVERDLMAGVGPALSVLATVLGSARATPSPYRRRGARRLRPASPTLQ